MTDEDGGGPLALLADGYREEVRRIGHRRRSESRHLGLMAHLSEWMVRHGVPSDGLTSALITAFLAERRRRGWRLITMTGARPLMDYLRRQGMIAEATPEAGRPLAPLMERYHDYLVRQRGLRSGTIANYERVAGRFIDAAAVLSEADLGSLMSADVSRVLLNLIRGRGRIGARGAVSSSRAFLRFLYIEGLIAAPLAGALPAYRSWRGGQLPRSLPPDAVDRLLRSCDIDTATGRRDRAVLTLLARLGLRAGEVAAMTLDDIDWRAGELLVHGKGPRTDRLPLPADVGEAVAAYLEHGRPHSDQRHVFLTTRAPLVGLSRSAITSLVCRAGDRAGVTPLGPHRLRHSAATSMLRSGASLTEIGQVLRHRRVDTTAIYAKVDEASLSLVARSWPEAAS